MKKVDFTVEELKSRVSNKYAAAIVIANRAKAIRENPADVDEQYRKQKPTVTALKEFINDKVKYPEFNLDRINIGD